MNAQRSRPALFFAHGASASEAGKGSPTPAPWSCHHRGDGSDLEAYSEAAGDWSLIARTLPGAGLDCMANAELIARAVNDFDLDKYLIRDLVAALGTCLQCDGLTWEAEQEANMVLARAHFAGM